uniref:Cleft lip and palate transmembrane protein 1-like protein n=1 Tax=Chaetoceros debilis TaxID=122233 RepID=A0A7S3Q1K8_9STRA
MWTIILLSVGYFAFSFYFLYTSSLPAEPCNELRNHDVQCAQPMLSTDTIPGEYTLQLWILDQVGEEESHMEMKLVDSCPQSNLEFSIEQSAPGLSAFRKLKFGRDDGKCELTFPQFSRERIDDQDRKSRGRPKILKGKFVLSKKSKDNGKERDILIAQTVFDLTRLVKFGETGKVPHYKYSRQPVVLRLVIDDQLYPLHAPIRGDGIKMMALPRKYHSPEDMHMYQPIFHVDDVALKHSSQIQMGPPQDEESDEPPKPPVKLRVNLSIISPLRHAVHVQLGTVFSMLESLFSNGELDEIRHMISDEYLYRFILTQLISYIHIYLDVMAFRNEVSFYVGKKSMAGISFSAVFGRFVCEFIIFLYLLDGGGTSWLVLGSVGSSVLVELWKVKKFLQPRFSASFPFVAFRRGSDLSQLEQQSMSYDSIARTYLGLVLYPIVVGSALYARSFYQYSSWWSWLISNAANAVYMFGFITLCPQLYINYRLKSVAHLPMKVFVYKIFNTFVDDVFAFMIEMPLKHKIMTLRDDIVFIIFLLQAYIYRVDKSRTNEFGYAYEEEDQIKSESEISRDEPVPVSDRSIEHEKNN